MAAPSSIQRLEPLPAIAIELLHRIASLSIDKTDLLELLGSQPHLLAEISEVSRQFALSFDESNGAQSAVEQISSPRLAEIAITVLVRSYLESAIRVSEDFRYWRYTLACSVCCGEVALPRQEDVLLAYTAGLLHDIGRLALIAVYPRQYSNLLTLTDRMFAAKEPFDMLEYERLLFGLDHFATGMFLAEAWKLPTWLRSVVGKFDDRASGQHAKLVSTIRAGTSLAHSLGFGYLTAAPRADIRKILGQFSSAEKLWKILDNWEYTEENLRGKVRSRLQWYAADESFKAPDVAGTPHLRGS